MRLDKFIWAMRLFKTRSIASKACAAEKVKMVLTGDGGDEVLSGYPGYQVEKFVAGYQKFPATLRHMINGAAHIAGGLSSGSLKYRMSRYERLLRTSSCSFQER